MLFASAIEDTTDEWMRLIVRVMQKFQTKNMLKPTFRPGKFNHLVTVHREEKAGRVA